MKKLRVLYFQIPATKVLGRNVNSTMFTPSKRPIVLTRLQNFLKKILKKMGENRHEQVHYISECMRLHFLVVILVVPHGLVIALAFAPARANMCGVI